jgi:hydroxymethylbilane synthase
MKIRIGTMGSKLALWQANYIKSLVHDADGTCETELVIIKTSGDAIQDVSLTQLGGKGLFVKEIEKALLSKDIDIAVHSMKDMPAEIPDGLYIAATPPAEEPWDVMVFNKRTTLSELTRDAVIGTTSLRRIVQLKRLTARNAILRFEMLRGNIDTRIKKLESGMYDAIVVAYAGINRLGIKPEFMEKLDIIPAAGQGIISIEAHKDNAMVARVLEKFNHPGTFLRAQAERGFITRLGGNCQVPIGAHASISMNNGDNNDRIDITGFIATPDGNKFYQSSATGNRQQAYDTGVGLAEDLLRLGASEILGL